LILTKAEFEHQIIFLAVVSTENRLSEYCAMLTFEDITKILTDANSRAEDITSENLEILISLDSYIFFGVDKFAFDQQKFDQNRKKLTLLAHPDKNKVSCPNKARLMQHINTIVDAVRNDQSKQPSNKTTLFTGFEESQQPTTQEEQEFSPDEQRAESPFHNPFTGPGSEAPIPRNPFQRPSGYEEMRFNGQNDASFKLFRPTTFVRNRYASATQQDHLASSYMVFFCIRGGSTEEKDDKKNELIKKYIENKEPELANLFHDNKIQSEIKEVIFKYAHSNEIDANDDDEGYLIVAFSTNSIRLNDNLLKRLAKEYVKTYSEYLIFINEKGFFSCLTGC